jgi:hypothetical protein
VVALGSSHCSLSQGSLTSQWVNAFLILDLPFFLSFFPSFFFLVILGLELWAYTLSHSTSNFFVKVLFRDRVSEHYLPGLASNWDRPDLCLLSS